MPWWVKVKDTGRSEDVEAGDSVWDEESLTGCSMLVLVCQRMREDYGGAPL